MKIGIIGANGRVGRKMVEQGCLPLDCDIRNPESIEKAIIDVSPDIVASFAAKSSPEWCQKFENFEEMLDVNTRGIVNLGEITQKFDIPTVTMSTDHIFSGRNYFDWRVKQLIKAGPYKESYNKIVPTNWYGISKYAGEGMALSFSHMKVVRTSYLFDLSRLEDDAYRIMTDYHNTISYPTFIYRSFMHVDHFVISLMSYLKNIENMPQLLHISGSQTVSWVNFMRAYLDMRTEECRGKMLTHRKDNKKFCPRPHKAGLVTTLSAKMGLPQFDYYDGLALL